MFYIVLQTDLEPLLFVGKEVVIVHWQCITSNRCGLHAEHSLCQ